MIYWPKYWTGWTALLCYFKNFKTINLKLNLRRNCVSYHFSRKWNLIWKTPLENVLLFFILFKVVLTWMNCFLRLFKLKVVLTWMNCFYFQTLNLAHNSFNVVPRCLACLAPSLSRLNLSFNALTKMGSVTSYPSVRWFGIL